MVGSVDQWVLTKQPLMLTLIWACANIQPTRRPLFYAQNTDFLPPFTPHPDRAVWVIVRPIWWRFTITVPERWH